MKKINLQVALDFIDLKRALNVAREAVSGGCDWIEAGTPLIKSEGLKAVRELKKMFPQKTIVADMKVMDAGRIEVEAAAKAGADVICVLGAATDATIAECVSAAKNIGAKIQVDLIGIKSPISRTKELLKIGVDIIGVHCSIDDQMKAKDPLKDFKEVVKIAGIPVSVAGGINSENAFLYAAAGADIIIVGGAITKSDDAAKAVKSIKSGIKKRVKIKSRYFKRINGDKIESTLSRVSTANVTDAMHRQGALNNFIFIGKKKKFFGRAVTVRTYPGDWAKPVQAIDVANPGDVIVIDAGGVGPAVWGELATVGAHKKKISGIIVNGAVRDSEEISRIGFPVYCRLVSPNAGEPKGFGEIGVPLNMSGITISPGDWILSDSDGVCVIPSKNAAEIANRSMNVCETENRLRSEILKGSTLGKVTELLRWEKIK